VAFDGPRTDTKGKGHERLAPPPVDPGGSGVGLIVSGDRGAGGTAGHEGRAQSRAGIPRSRDGIAADWRDLEMGDGRPWDAKHEAVEDRAEAELVLA
jgi:hypothetical protein